MAGWPLSSGRDSRPCRLTRVPRCIARRHSAWLGRLPASPARGFLPRPSALFWTLRSDFWTSDLGGWIEGVGHKLAKIKRANEVSPFINIRQTTDHGGCRSYAPLAASTVPAATRR
eukprot:scaffold68137_cov54-Phaeocystis_antarctica.AAC.1